VIDSGVVPFLIDFLEESPIALITPALRILGNISTGNAEQTGVVLSNGILPRVEKLLSHQKQTIKRETCWLLSNIAAGT
jgi:hypothetical protein